MQVKQIASIMNEVFKEQLGEENLLNDNLSNVVSSGEIITSDSEVMSNFDNYAKKIIDKVGRTIFWDRVYKADDLGLWRDAFEYGSVLEKIRCDVGDYSDNCQWKLTEKTGDNLDYNTNIATHIAEMFKFYPASVQAKYFNSKTTLKAVVSIAKKQLREAFRSASQLSRFISMIENRLLTKMEITKMQLQKMTLANLACEHIAQGKQVVDLKALYVAEVDSTATGMTFAQALSTGRAARFIGQKIAWFREMMKEPSKLYSATGTFYNHTPIEDSRLIVLADLDSALRFNVYGDTYNEEFVKLDNYKTVPFWQSSGTDNALATRSGYNVVTSAGHTVLRNNIVGILFDRDAAMICNEEPETEAIPNKDGGFVNYFHMADCSYYTDFDENCIVFVWGASDTISFVPALTATGAASGKTIVTAASLPSGGSIASYKYNLNQYNASTNPDPQPVPLSIGKEPPVSPAFSSLTGGTTQIAVAAGDVITVAALDSDGAVVEYGAVTVTADDIGS